MIVQSYVQLPKETLKTLKELMTLSGEQGNLPNSAVLIDSKTHDILSSSPSLVATNTDATAHAERLVISKYCQKIGKPFFSGAILVTVFEPCLMCLSAAYWAGIKEVWFIIRSSLFWSQIPWLVESKKLEKSKIINNFEPPLILRHLSLYENEFANIAQPYIEKIIKRE